MYQLSSSSTLILRLFIPTIWVVFFGSFAVVGWMTSEDFVGPFQTAQYKIITTLFVLVGIILIRLSFWRLHRVDADPDHLYVSNYLKTYKYSLESMEQISIRHYGLFYLGRVDLVAKGKLGRKIWFVPSQKRIEQFLRNNPTWMDLVKWR